MELIQFKLMMRILYRAAICCNGKEIRLGCFVTEIEAAKAYNEAALKYHGEYAKLNVL